MQSTIRLVAKLSCLALVVALVAGMAFAQTTKGTIAGIVTDNTDAVITGATVTATAAGGGETRTVTTGANGEYRIEALTPGEFTITVSAPGFGKKNVTNVVVRTSMITSNNVQLAIASASEVISVEASPDQIQTESGELSKTISTVSVRDLPYSSANPYQLATTLPGVSTVVARDDMSNGYSFSVNGLRPRSNNFLIDGFDNNDNSIQGQAFQPQNTEAVQEVTLLTNSYTAEFGRGGASVSNLTFRSGNNAYHGALWEQYNGSILNALTATEKRQGVIREDCTQAQLDAGCTRGPGRSVSNTFGFRVGGPVIKNKLFFFATSQWSKFYGAQNPGPLLIPNAAGVATLKSVAAGDAATAGNIGLITGALGNIVGKTNEGSVELGNRPGCVLSPTTGTCAVDYGFFQRSDPAANLGNEWTARADYVGTNDSFLVRYTNSVSNLSPDLGNNPSLPYSDTQVGGPSRLLGTMWSHTFTPSLMNEFRFSAQSLDFAFKGTPATLASPYANLPSIFFGTSLTAYFGGYGQGGFPQGRGHKTFQLQDAVSWTKGTHNIKMGADLAILLVKDTIPFNFNGIVTFADGGDCSSIGLETCTDMANFIDGFMGSGGSLSRSFGTPVISVPTNQQAYYFQDSWKFRPNLTVDYGVRYEYQPPDASNVLQYPAIDRNFKGQSFLKQIQQKPDRNNFGPRFGFAYTPRFWQNIFGEDKTVIRGGYGVFYDAFFTNISQNTAGNFPNALGVSILGGDGRAQQDPLGFLQTATGVVDPTAILNSVAPNLTNPMIQQWNLNVQRELPAKTQLEVAYVGTRGEHLWTNEQFNPRILTTQYVQGARFDPTRGTMIVRDNGADSIYHGLQATVTRNVKNLNLRGSYTFSRAIDNSSEVFTTTGGTNRRMILNNPNSDRGVSAYDRMHRAAISYVYEVPFAPSNGILKAVLGGWANSGVFSVQSGAPETIYLGSYDMNGDGELNNDRPILSNANATLNYSAACRKNGSGCNTGVGVVSKTGVITALFSNAPVTANQVKFLMYPQNSGINGTVGRNSMYYPGLWTFDTSMFKRVKMPFNEAHQVEFRADLLDAFNHKNAGMAGFNGNLRTSTFDGLDSTIRGGRVIQLWLKYQF
jgi:Carboxypeptidase regulatory-like domain/TonB-dependent Receptor Plug Domain